MLVGDCSTFAIESEISKAYERKSFRALGFFLIHIGGHCYGVRSAEATMLACSYDEVGDRASTRGKHTAPFATELRATKIAEAVSAAVYGPPQLDEHIFGIARSKFHDLIFHNKLLWAPDGDEAFDDGSHVLHFDIEDRVRLIGFKRDKKTTDGIHDLAEVWINANTFYDLLQRWHDEFGVAWVNMVRINI